MALDPISKESVTVRDHFYNIANESISKNPIQHTHSVIYDAAFTFRALNESLLKKDKFRCED